MTQHISRIQRASRWDLILEPQGNHQHWDSSKAAVSPRLVCDSTRTSVTPSLTGEANQNWILNLLVSQCLAFITLVISGSGCPTKCIQNIKHCMWRPLYLPGDPTKSLARVSTKSRLEDNGLVETDAGRLGWTGILKKGLNLLSFIHCTRLSVSLPVQLAVFFGKTYQREDGRMSAESFYSVISEQIVSTGSQGCIGKPDVQLGQNEVTLDKQRTKTSKTLTFNQKRKTWEYHRLELQTAWNARLCRETIKTTQI